MILSFSDSEEHIFNKMKEVLNNETEVEYVGELSGQVLSFPGLDIHIKEQTVYRDGDWIQMSRQEFCLLHFLAEHPGWVFSIGQIYEAVYDESEAEHIDNSVYCLIHSLRKKIERDPQHPQYIQTVRSVGYKFVIPAV